MARIHRYTSSVFVSLYLLVWAVHNIFKCEWKNNKNYAKRHVFKIKIFASDEKILMSVSYERENNKKKKCVFILQECCIYFYICHYKIRMKQNTKTRNGAYVKPTAQMTLLNYSRPIDKLRSFSWHDDSWWWKICLFPICVVYTHMAHNV